MLDLQIPGVDAKETQEPRINDIRRVFEDFDHEQVAYQEFNRPEARWFH